MTSCAILKNRGILHIHGVDAKAFLQGMMTNDMEKAIPSQAIYTAILNAQGRFLHDFFVYADAKDSFYIDCALDEVDELIKRFKQYRLRSKASIDNRSDTLSVVVSDAFLADGFVFQDPRLKELGYRALLTQDQLAKLTLTDDEKYLDQLMTLGIPNGRADMPAEKAIILEYGFIDLNGIDFNKGCYVGQELMARTHHQGIIRKRLFPVVINGVADAEITFNGEKAGKLISKRGAKGLALLYTDKALDSINGNTPLTAGGAKLSVAKPEWMNINVC